MELRAFVQTPHALTLTRPEGVRQLFPSLVAPPPPPTSSAATGPNNNNGGSGGERLVARIVDELSRSGVEARSDAYLLPLVAPTTKVDTNDATRNTFLAMVGLKGRDVSGKKHFGKKVEIKFGDGVDVLQEGESRQPQQERYLGTLDSWSKQKTKLEGMKGGIGNIPAVVSWLKELKEKGGGGVGERKGQHLELMINHLTKSVGAGKEKLYLCIIDKARRQGYVPTPTGAFFVEETDVKATLREYDLSMFEGFPGQPEEQKKGRPKITTSSPIFAEARDQQQSPGGEGEDPSLGREVATEYFRSWAVEGDAEDSLKLVLSDWEKIVVAMKQQQSREEEQGELQTKTSGSGAPETSTATDTTAGEANKESSSTSTTTTTTGGNRGRGEDSSSSNSRFFIGSYPGFLNFWFDDVVQKISKE